jgi:hypothetical protein
MLPLSEVQTAFFTALTPAMAPVPVIDQAAPNQVFPYVTIGEFIGDQLDTLEEEAIDLDLTVHVWSRQPGMQECQQLMTKAKDALHRQRLPVSGFQWVDTIWEYAQTMRDPDGMTRHGILRFRVVTFSSV